MSSKLTSHIVGLTALLCCFFSSGEATCSFPSDLTGTWILSEPSIPTKTFTSTQVSTFSVTSASTTYDNLIFECYLNSGDLYVMKTTTPIDIITVDFDVFFCWSLSRQSSNKFLYYVGTDENSVAGGDRMKIIPITTTVTDVSAVCDSTTFTNGQFRVMLKQGTASTEKITCPDPMLATGTYTMTDSSGTNSCTDGTSSLDGCTTAGTLTANLTACSTTIFSSAGGEALCMYSEDFDSTNSSTNTYYVSVFNTDSSVDSSSTHFFTCIVVYSDPNNDSIAMSTHPNYCFNTTYQTATLMSQTGGYTIDWTASTTCLPVSESTTSVSSSGLSTMIIVIIVVCCLLFIAIVLLVIYLVYKYVYLKDKTRPGSRIVPDTLPNTAMSQADKNKRMMFTPGPPKSAGPGGRQGDYYDGGRAGSEVSLHPTVSQLANYRTPTPFISDSKVEEGEVLAEMRETPHPGPQEPTTPASQTGDTSRPPSSVLLVSEGNARSANDNATKSGVRFKDEQPPRDNDIASPDSHNSLPEADRNRDHNFLKQFPLLAAIPITPEQTSKQKEAYKNNTLAAPKLVEKTVNNTSDKNETRELNMTAIVTAKSLARSLIGDGVYTTAAAVLLPGTANRDDAHGSDKTDSVPTEMEKHVTSASGALQNANKNENSSNHKPEMSTQGERRSSTKIAGELSVQEDTSKSNVERQSSAANQSLAHSQIMSKSPPPDGKLPVSIETTEALPEDAEKQPVQQTMPNDSVIETNETTPPERESGIVSKEPTAITNAKSSKHSLAKQTPAKTPERPKSNTIKTTNKKETLAKQDRPKSSVQKPRVPKKGVLKKTDTPKREKQDMLKSETPNLSKAAVLASITSSTNNVNQIEANSDTLQQTDEQSPGLVRPPSTTTIISHKSNARPTSAAPSKTPTPSVKSSEPIKTKSHKATKPPPSRTSTPSKKLQSEINKGKNNPSISKSPKIEENPINKGPPTRVKSATQKRHSQDPREEHNPFADPRAATNTPIAIIRPDDIARIKSAANKRLVNDFKVRTVRTPAPTETPVKGRTRENKKMLPAFILPETNSVFPSQTHLDAWPEKEFVLNEVPNGTAGNHTANGKDMDVDSILDFDMKRIGEPDGAESGVMIDMEGSLPVFSESGDLTPEPTRVTPQEKTPRRHKRDK